MEKPWMPTVAGILDIVSGAAGLVGGLFLTFARSIASAAGPGGAIQHWPRFGMHPPIPVFPGIGIIGIVLIVVSVLAIVGGIFTLRQKTWGMALAGSIAAVISGRLLGVIALILTVLGKKDFK